MVFRDMAARNLSNQHFKNVYRLEISTLCVCVYTHMSRESMLILFVKKNVERSVECSPKMLWYIHAFYEWVKMSGIKEKTNNGSNNINNEQYDHPAWKHMSEKSNVTATQKHWICVVIIPRGPKNPKIGETTESTIHVSVHCKFHSKRINERRWN